MELYNTGKVIKPLWEPSELQLVQTEEQYQQLMDKIQKAEVIAFDSETNGLQVFMSSFKIAGLCFAFGVNEGIYLPINHRSPDCAFADGLFHKVSKYPFHLFDQERVKKDLIAAGLSTKPLIGHNIKFDLHVLRRLGVPHNAPVLDTLLIGQVENPYRENGLKQRVLETFGYHPEEMDWSELEDGFCATDPRMTFTYAAADPVNTLRLAYHFVQSLADTKIMQVCETVEFPLTPKLVDIEAFGVHVNTEQLNEFSEEISPHAMELERLIRKYAGIEMNPASPDEKFNLIYKYLRVPYPEDKEPDRRGATDDETLEAVLAKIEEVTDGLKRCRSDLVDCLSGRMGVFEILDNAYTWLRRAREPVGRVNRYEAVTKNKIQFVIDQIDVQLEELPIKTCIVEMLMSWTKLQKLKTAFVDKLPEMRSDIDDRIHTEFRQILHSGRQAGKKPNLMQLPRDDEYEIAYPDRDRPTIVVDVRKTILPPPGWKFVSADWDAMEMKMCAAISGCPVLTEVVTGKDPNGKDYDAHIKTAEMMGLLDGMDYLTAMKALKEDGKDGNPLHPKHKFVKVQRQTVKPIGFGLIYGITKWGLAVKIKCSPEEAEELMNRYFDVYYGVKQWLDETYESAEALGWAETALGRRRLIPMEAYDDEMKLSHYLRACGNHLIQGGCADMAKFCEVQVIDALKGRDAFFCNFIHDEMIIAAKDTPEELSYAGAVLEACMQKKWRGVLFTATAEVKDNLSKKADNLAKTIPGFGNPQLLNDVLHSLKLTKEEVQALPW